MQQMIAAAAAALGINSALKSYEVIKTGNINQTYKVLFEDGSKYIIQRVNTYVFKNPHQMMDNIAGVTRHLRAKYAKRGVSPDRFVLNYLHTDNGEYFYVDRDGSFWRGYHFVDGTVTYDSVPDLGLLTSAGFAFGDFVGLLADYDMDSLYDTIPDFHNTAKRYTAFCRAVEQDTAGRAAGIRDEIDYINSHAHFYSQLTDMQAEGSLKTRVTHNDTKYNNVLIDVATHKPSAIIDLDTVMPGLAAYDFGDAIRFAANTSAEDEPDISKTSLSLESYEAFAKGYVSALRDSFDETELMSLPTGALMMTLELVMRFCTDYLMGDPYFKLNYPEHNLVRTRCQMALAKDMESKFADMQSIIRKYM